MTQGERRAGEAAHRRVPRRPPEGQQHRPVPHHVVRRRVPRRRAHRSRSQGAAGESGGVSVLLHVAITGARRQAALVSHARDPIRVRQRGQLQVDDGQGQDRYALADRMAKAWVAFARTGNPNHAGLPKWDAFDTTTRTTMVLRQGMPGRERSARRGAEAAAAAAVAWPDRLPYRTRASASVIRAASSPASDQMG